MRGKSYEKGPRGLSDFGRLAALSNTASGLGVEVLLQYCDADIFTPALLKHGASAS